jgi:dihydrolipoamide dehydrogenase
MKSLQTTLLVIGGGPGGYVAAIRAGQLGIRTLLVDGDRLGGTCLNIGCIPSKALIHAADEFDKARHFGSDHPLGISVKSAAIDIGRTMAWKDGIVGKLTGGVGALLKKNKVQVLQGWATIVDGKNVDVVAKDGAARVSCDHLLLATGSSPAALPSLPFGDKVISSTEALALTEVPKHLVVIGAGYIGLELGMAWRKFGAEVTVVEALGRVLPQYDAELTKPVAASLHRLGVEVHLDTKALGLNSRANAVRVQAADGTEAELRADRVLVTVGRRPRTQGFGLESLGLDMNGPSIRIDDQCRTSMRNVWAIGDVTGEPMLAHRAMAQGETVAEIISGKTRRFQPAAIPAVCFTDPEVVTVGLDSAAAQRAQIEVTSATFPFAANGRALSMEASEGYLRVVARKDNHLIIGWQAVGRGVSELSAAFSQSIEMGARLEDISGTIHAHPTLGETVQEAALRALGHALHV